MKYSVANATDIASDIKKYLANKYVLESTRTAPSVEGGITIFYKNKNKELIIEADDEGYVVALINQNKEIVDSVMICNNNDLDKIISEYLSEEA